MSIYVLLVLLVFVSPSSQIQIQQPSATRVAIPYCRFLILRTEDQNRVGVCCVDVATDVRDLIYTISEETEEAVTAEDIRTTTTDAESSTASTPDEEEVEKRDAEMNVQRRCKKRVPLKKSGELVGRCCIFEGGQFGDDLESVDLPKEDENEGTTTVESAKKGPFKWRSSGMRVDKNRAASSSYNILNSQCNEGFVLDNEGDCVSKF